MFNSKRLFNNTDIMELNVYRDVGCLMNYITIITICLNDKEGLKKTMDSVLNQQHASFEYVVKDGESTDGTNEMLKEYEKAFADKEIEFKHFIKKDSGIYDAMNQGLDFCSDSNYVLFLNAGDTLYDKNVMQLLASIKFQNTADAMIGATNSILSNGGEFIEKPLINKDSIRFCHQSVLVRTKLMKEIRFNTKYRVAADRDLLLKLFEDGYHLELINIIVSTFDREGVSSRNFSALYEEIDDINHKYNRDSKKHNRYVNSIKTKIVSINPMISDYMYIWKRIKGDSSVKKTN
ncbi:glycosyltransferase [Butyrivibrio sp. YAB3001]|uniref:glycosyltransferase n=1 Tax=Butyrivibrio sp. YAB3001 TaxID=1520812 RepID=UPI0008F64794|nr:glycosyltransferase [Butyrivibrio sp. YAB3001]SFC80449.1 Glycosyltransferase involved in cell wall bisynthesis [Butyrivibrio sp. YAB3001]